MSMGAAIAAPAVVRADGLMKVRGIILPAPRPSFTSVLLDAAGRVIQSHGLTITPHHDDCGLTHVDLLTDFPTCTRTGDVVTKWEVRDEAGRVVIDGVQTHPVMMVNGLSVRMGLTIDKNLAINMHMAQGN